MTEQNLILNILTFNHPVVKKDFAIYTEKKNGCLPINHYEFPLNIEEIIPDAKTQKLQQLYTDFENTSDKEAVISSWPYKVYKVCKTLLRMAYLQPFQNRCRCCKLQFCKRPGSLVSRQKRNHHRIQRLQGFYPSGTNCPQCSHAGAYHLLWWHFVGA